MNEEKEIPLYQDPEIRELLDRLAEDESAIEAREAVCAAISEAFAQAGRALWVTGYIVGGDRPAGKSPFGDDATVGLATVLQIAGELGRGTIELLRAGNRYSAAALVRQLVEVEYLAHAFVDEDQIAADWLRADREQRLRFWSPKKLRKRASREFLPQDYWRHCELGGHPATPGMALLPDHEGLPIAFLWVDLAGHLNSTWHAIESLVSNVVPDVDDWERHRTAVGDARRRWGKLDLLAAAMQDIDRVRREDSEEPAT